MKFVLIIEITGLVIACFGFGAMVATPSLATAFITVIGLSLAAIGLVLYRMGRR